MRYLDILTAANTADTSSDALRADPSKSTFKPSKAAHSALLLCALLAFLPISQAQEVEADGTQWGEWEPIDKGFIARKKVPPRMHLKADKRALKSVTQQRSRLLKKKARLQAKIKQAGRSQKNIGKLRARLAETKSQLALWRSVNRVSRATRQGGAWLYNGAEGLHSISVTELAETLEITERLLRRQLNKGKFALTNNGQSVSYYYDKAAGQVLYAAESYQTLYTDENAYRARFSKADAQPMTVQNGKGKRGPGQANAFADTLKFEEEPDMYFDVGATRADQDVDYWFWDYMFGVHKNSITVALNAPNPAATGDAQLRIKMRGWTNLYDGDEHQVVAELNGQAVGAALTWDAYSQVVLVANFDQSLLDASGDNSLLIRSIYAEGTTPGEYLDNIELDYMRLPVAENGQLWLHQVARGKQRVSGFSSKDVVVIEDPAGSAVLRKDIRFKTDANGFSVVFKARAGVDYMVAEQGVAAEPQIEAGEAASLADAANMGEYLIIAPRDFSGTAESLARLREAQFGSVKIAWLDQIYAEYSAGRADPFAIARFMQDISGTWLVAPTHVVIVGNGSLDHKNRMGYDESFVPPMLTVTLDIVPWARSSSDDRLLGADGDAEFAIGRIPILSDAEGMAYVEKLSRYALAAPDGSATRSVLVADNPDAAGDFHANSDIVSDWMLGSLGFTETTKLYHPTNSAVRSTLTDSATWDSHSYLSYDGHGTISQLGSFRENFITRADAEVLSNTQYPVFTALTCAAGEYALPGVRSVAASMVLNPNGGAIAAMAPTGLSLDQDAQFMGYIYAGTLLGSSKSTIGEAVQRAKLLSKGEVNDFMTRIYSVVGDPAVKAR
jgi:hypothetical protein